MQKKTSYIYSLFYAPSTILLQIEKIPYIGFTLRWDYVNCAVNLYMPGYTEKVLHRFCVLLPTEPQYSPHQWLAPS